MDVMMMLVELVGLNQQNSCECVLIICGREQRIPVPLAYLEGSSEQEGREQEGSEGSFSAGWGKTQTRDCAHDHMWQECSYVTEHREKLGGMEERYLL